MCPLVSRHLGPQSGAAGLGRQSAPVDISPWCNQGQRPAGHSRHAYLPSDFLPLHGVPSPPVQSAEAGRRAARSGASRAYAVHCPTWRITVARIQSVRDRAARLGRDTVLGHWLVRHAAGVAGQAGLSRHHPAFLTCEAGGGHRWRRPSPWRVQFQPALC